MVGMGVPLFTSSSLCIGDEIHRCLEWEICCLKNFQYSFNSLISLSQFSLYYFYKWLLLLLFWCRGVDDNGCHCC
jgi:hypothetical protein